MVNQNVISSELYEACEYLAHFGKGHLNGGHSGRYPWGSGERPMQSEGGGRKGVDVKELAGKMARSIGGSAKKAVQRNIPVVRRVPENASQETKEEIKKKLLERGVPSEILHNAHLFTTQELNDYLNRQRAIQGVQGMVPKKKGFRNALNETTQTINSLISFYDTGKKIWDRAKPALEKAGVLESEKKQDEGFGKMVAEKYMETIMEAYMNADEANKLNSLDKNKLTEYASILKNLENIDKASRNKPIKD